MSEKPSEGAICDYPWEERIPYPKAGDYDIVQYTDKFRKYTDISGHEKVLLTLKERKISIFESQLAPILDHFKKNQASDTVKVTWKLEGKYVVAGKVEPYTPKPKKG